MEKLSLNIIIIAITLIVITGCSNSSKPDEHHHDTEGQHFEDTNLTHDEQDEHGEEFTLTQRQIEILKITIDTVSKRRMSGFIQVNGLLGVPPQNEAIVTTVLGANISSIKVIEGDKVRKGQVLAYISHPEIIRMQTDYLQAYNRLTFLELDYKRQKKLYEAKVGSGRDYQQAKSTYLSEKGLTLGFESQLRLIGLSPQTIQNGNIANTSPIKSPIDGFIEKVKIKSGQYVQPQTTMFEVVNTDHIHVDLMIFEKDISQIKNGQLVKFSIEAIGNTEMTAKIYSIGKSFEEGPKALHVHAEIANKDKNLIPGMYVSARIITNNTLEVALPESAIFQEGDQFYIFTAEKEVNGSWGFTPKEVLVKLTNNGFTSFDFIAPINKNVLVAQSGAYYLMAEMKKSEAEHSH